MKLQTIVVGFDGSDTAMAAVDTASQLIADTGVVHVVTAYSVPSVGETASMLSQLPPEFRVNYDPVAVPRAEAERAAAILDSHDVTSVTHLVDDHPAAAILDVADEIDAQLIIVGSRGLTRTTRFIRGSVSTRVAAHSKRSFMVIHDND